MHKYLEFWGCTIKYYSFADLVSCQQKRTGWEILLLFFFPPTTVASGISLILQINKKHFLQIPKNLEFLLGMWQEQVD